MGEISTILMRDWRLNIIKFESGDNKGALCTTSGSVYVSLPEHVRQSGITDTLKRKTGTCIFYLKHLFVLGVFVPKLPVNCLESARNDTMRF